MVDIALRTGRPITTVEGVATQQITKDMLKNRCANTTYSRLNGFETSMMTLPTITATTISSPSNNQPSTSTAAAKRKGEALAGRERMMMFKQYLTSLDREATGELVRSYAAVEE